MGSSAQITGAYIASLMAINKSALPLDGGEKFNRLIFARSPYLLQHAQNPVDWHEWGDEAFERARSENLPILLSIGYATCHWCHVMAHESFEDSEVAALLNHHFVCIKVDKEERPDIDDFYMTVSQLLTGSGGWPLNIFMTPDKRPFMAITYLPKRKRGATNGLMELLANIATLWVQKPEMIEKNCQGIMEGLAAVRQVEGPVDTSDCAALSRNALSQLQRMYDPLHGGFGDAPKFPMPIFLSWLISQGQGQPHTHSEGEGAVIMSLQTLRKIRSGGIWDQLGGGLHRYSVDRKWLAPHFEKMLYDQAMLALVALDAYQATADPFFSSMADEIFTFTERELLSREGAFCSALDADSEGVEGKFYVWDKQEIAKCLGDDSEIFCSFFEVSERGNFEEKNILNTPVELEEFCHRNNLDAIETESLLKRCCAMLLQKREKRIRPLRDDKIITSWNGLMIAALARAGCAFDNQRHIESAARTARFILNKLRRADGRLLRSYLNGPSDIPAFLEDYSFLTLGLLELYEATLKITWLEKATLLTDEMLQLFRDPASGEFTLTGQDAEQMPIRISSDHDGVTPSALSTTAMILLRLAWTLERPDLKESARSALTARLDDIRRNPLGHLGALQVLDSLDAEPVTATLSGPVDSPELSGLLCELKKRRIPNLAVLRKITSSNPEVTICGNQTCYPAVSTPEKLADFLQQKGFVIKSV